MAKKTKKPINEMTFLDHLEELRWLLVRSSIAILVGGIIAYFIDDYIFDTILFGPMKGDFVTYRFFCDLAVKYNLDKGFCHQKLNFILQNTELDGQVSIYFWTLITAGFVISFPYILLQFWNFIGPALYKNEKQNVAKFITICSILFFIGVLFGYFVITPMALNFTTTFQLSKLNVVVNDINIDNYIGTIKMSSLASGITFELPIIIYFLSKFGLVTPQSLRKYRKYSYVIILIVAAIVTPADVSQQIIVTIPLIILYEISIFISAVIYKQNNKKTATT